jgi:hypothetical protein
LPTILEFFMLYYLLIVDYEFLPHCLHTCLNIQLLTFANLLTYYEMNTFDFTFFENQPNVFYKYWTGLITFEKSFCIFNDFSGWTKYSLLKGLKNRWCVRHSQILKFRFRFIILINYTKSNIKFKRLFIIIFKLINTSIH